MAPGSDSLRPRSPSVDQIGRAPAPSQSLSVMPPRPKPLDPDGTREDAREYLRQFALFQFHLDAEHPYVADFASLWGNRASELYRMSQDELKRKFGRITGRVLHESLQVSKFSWFYHLDFHLLAISVLAFAICTVLVTTGHYERPAASKYVLLVMPCPSLVLRFFMQLTLNDRRVSNETRVPEYFIYRGSPIRATRIDT